VLASSVSVHPLRTVDGLADRVSPIHHPAKKLIENLNKSRNMDYYFMTTSKTMTMKTYTSHFLLSNISVIDEINHHLLQLALKAGSFLVLLQTEAIITNFFHFFHF